MVMDIYTMHLRSLEILPLVRPRNAFKLRTLKRFEDVKKAYLKPSSENLHLNFKP